MTVSISQTGGARMTMRLAVPQRTIDTAAATESARRLLLDMLDTVLHRD